MAISTETRTVTTEVISIPYQEVDALRNLTWITFAGIAATVIVLFIWSFHSSNMGFLATGGIMVLVIWAFVADMLKDRLKRKHGWTGAYPHRVTLEYPQHFLSE